MKQSDLYRQNAENCMQMAEAATGEPTYNRFKRMKAAWLALAEEQQDWLDGEQSPVGSDQGLGLKGDETARARSHVGEAASDRSQASFRGRSGATYFKRSGDFVPK
jgi:hypothetical protein